MGGEQQATQRVDDTGGWLVVLPVVRAELLHVFERRSARALRRGDLDAALDSAVVMYVLRRTMGP